MLKESERILELETNLNEEKSNNERLQRKLEQLTKAKNELERNSSAVKNILLIGRTGNGKSTLANILTNTNNFQESPSSTSETRKIKTGKFIHNGQKYQIIDTIGIGDTKLSEVEVLDELLRAISNSKDGIHRIFLVISKRLTKEEIATYHLLKDVIFTEDIASHITIVRTNFPDFQDEQKCFEDRKKIQEESDKLSDITNSAKIIYVDNPSTDIRSREKSRNILLKHLVSYQNIYKTLQFDELINLINNYINKAERVEIIRAKLREVNGKISNKEGDKEIKKIEKELENSQQEKENALAKVMKSIKEKKE